jgi:mannose-6-phosphate isomerase-like protein (cupin superfamily)
MDKHIEVSAYQLLTSLWRFRMKKFEIKNLPEMPDAIAPDGSDVRILLGLKSGGMAHFTLGPGLISHAVTHQTVEEIWYFLSGNGQMWLKQNENCEVVDVYPGICLTIPIGTYFQFRSFGSESLTAIRVTMPPWPGVGEAIIVKGEWEPTIQKTYPV